MITQTPPPTHYPTAVPPKHLAVAAPLYAIRSVQHGDVRGVEIHLNNGCGWQFIRWDGEEGWWVTEEGFFEDLSAAVRAVDMGAKNGERFGLK